MEAEISALGTVQRSQRGRLRDFQVALQAQMKLKTITCNDRLQHAWLYGFFRANVVAMNRIPGLKVFSGQVRRIRWGENWGVFSQECLR